MATRAATFNTKIKNLRDIHLRINAGSGAQPSGIDVATTLKYFSHTLNSMTRELSSEVLDQLLSPAPQNEKLRQTIFPDLDYNGLYHALQSLADDIQLINTGAIDFAEAVLSTISAILIFLDPEKIEDLPFLCISCIAAFPSQMHRRLIVAVCDCFIPFVTGYYAILNASETQREPLYAASMMSTVFEHINDQELHLLMVETLMKAKPNLSEDLLMLIAYGSVRSKVYSVRILFYLFPHLVPAGEETYAPAQNDFSTSSAGATIIDVAEEEGFVGVVGTSEDDGVIGAEFQKRRQKIPALRCFNLGRLKRPSVRCENQRCGSNRKTVYTICCSWECGKLNSFKPFRLCRECSNLLHQNDTGKLHNRQCFVPMKDERLLYSQYLIDAIIKLMKNCGTEKEKRPTTGTTYQLPASVIEEDNSWTLDFPLEDLKAYTIYGVWLLREVLASQTPIPENFLRFLVDACLKWLHSTSAIRDDHLSRRLEHLKQRYICPWIKKLSAENPQVVVVCLADQAGIKDAALLPYQVQDVYESLQILLCLASYDIVDIRVWVEVMPVWLRNLKNHENPKTDVKGYSKLLLKLLDTEMSLMPFNLEETYSFIFNRLRSGSIPQAYKALVWLQVLCNYKIVVPIRLLLEHFQHATDALILENTLRPKRKAGDAALSRAPSAVGDTPEPDSPEADSTLPCFVVMLDVLCHQLEAAQNFQEVGWEYLRVRTMLLLTRMIASPWHGKVNEQLTEDQTTAQHRNDSTYYPALWFKLSHKLLDRIFSLRNIHGSDFDAGASSSSQKDTDFSPPGTVRTRSDVHSVRSELSSVSELKPQSSRASDITRFYDPNTGSLRELQNTPTLFAPHMLHAREEQISLMNEETSSFDLTQAEKIAPVIVRAVTLTDEDTGMAACTAAEPKSIDEVTGRGTWFSSDDFGFWHTTQGKFKFLLSELPYELQLLYGLSKLVTVYSDQSLLCDIVRSIKIICLEGHALSSAVKEARGFLIWAQENILIPIYWKIIGHERDYLASEVLPLIAHCASLGSGTEVFWNILDDHFLNDAWTIRFSAVVKTCILFRFVDSANELLNNLHSVLANGFCHLIASMFDEEAVVAEAAGLWIKCLKRSSVEFLMKCMQTHYALVIDDRPTILQRILHLSNALSVNETFSWQFFHDCFDTLCLEAEMELHDLGYTLDDMKGRATMTPEARREKIVQVRRAIRTSKDMKAIVVRGKLTNPNHRALLSSPATGELTPRTESQFFPTPDLSTPLEPISVRKPRTGATTTFPADHWKDFTEEETSYPSRIYKAVNGLAGSTLDRAPLYALINTFMKYLTRTPVATTETMESMELEVRRQTLLKFNYFLGYHNEGGNFTVLVKDLRFSTSFFAFLASLPEVLDSNVRCGGAILNIAVALLGYCTTSQNEVAFSSRISSFGRNLSYLPPHCRLFWMKSLFILIFKYGSEDVLEQQNIQRLILLCINSVRSLGHICNYESAQSQGHLSKKSSFISDIDGRESGWRATQDDKSEDLLKDGRSKDRSQFSESAVPLISEPSADSGGRSEGDSRRHPLSFDSSQDSADDSASRGASDSKTPFSPSSSKDVPDMSAATELIGKLTEAIKNAPPPDLIYREITLHGTQKATGTDETPRDPNEPYSKILSDCIEQTSQSRSAFKDTQKLVAQTQEFDPDGNSMEASTKVTILENDVVQIQKLKKWTKTTTATYVVKRIGPMYESPLGATYSGAPMPDVVIRSSTTTTTPTTGLQKENIAHSQPLPPGADQDGAIEVGEARVVKTKEPLPDLARQITRTYQSRSYPVTRPRKLVCTPLTKEDRFKFRRPLSAILSEEGDENEGSQPPPEAQTPRRRDAMSHIFAVALKQTPLTTESGETEKIVSLPPLPSHNTLFNRKCPNCGETVHSLREDDISWSILCLEALIRRHPALATPLLLDILEALVCAATHLRYSWQNFGQSVFTPGNLLTTIRQFVRVMAIQLGPSRLFPVLFLSRLPGSMLLEIVASSLSDCEEFNALVPLQHCLETCYSAKDFPSSHDIQIIIANICVYMEFLPLEVPLSSWGSVIDHFDKFLRRIPDGYVGNARVLAKLLQYVLRIPGMHANKNIMEPVSRLFRQILRSNQVPSLIDIKDICGLCFRAHFREREKIQLARVVAETLLDAIKFRKPMPENNLVILVSSAVQDLSEGEFHFSTHEFDSVFHNGKKPELQISQCLRENLMEVIEFLSDLHAINNLRQHDGGAPGFMFNDDTSGGSIKAGLAQVAAFEIIRESARDTKVLQKFFPWLLNPSTGVQQGNKDFEDCVIHIRLLSWLLLGALETMITIPPPAPHDEEVVPFQLFPFTLYSCFADRVLLILSCFAEQSQSSQNSLERMGSLSHAFTLCELWTVYCELSASIFPTESDDTAEDATTATSSLFSFWTKVTPAVLQLVSHSKNLAEIVGINFLAMMEHLKECNSVLLNKLLPMWVGVLLPPESQLPLAVRMRFRTLETVQTTASVPMSPSTSASQDYKRSREPLQKWLLRVQFKISQIEKQYAHALRFIPL
ncbi:protein unc-79 homolog [Paramacrobiotus metropolitanus]|uniref:protein unc-79 homolog n=1 Tax=Paramacrobiotus metropolitanus TaxID=2943436 RepID=UPI00244612D0|nr:protein unc-79 homolog [Paramacrobiotus metropolitanus]